MSNDLENTLSEISETDTQMNWTSGTVVLKLYETVDAARRVDAQRVDAQRLEQWLSVLRRRPVDEVFSALIEVFRSADRPYNLHQEYAGRLLLALKPPCPFDIEATIKRVLPTWDYSVEQLPQYFDAAVGRERVLQALDALRSRCASEEEQRAIETFRYWLRTPNSDGTVTQPPTIIRPTDKS